MNKELLEALNILEKENNISKDTLLEAIENSLLIEVFAINTAVFNMVLICFSISFFSFPPSSAIL